MGSLPVMGKLLNMLRRAEPVAQAQGTLVDVEIVGEASYQKTIRGLAKRGGEFQIVARAEPNNTYDRNAVALLVDGQVVGYLPREVAKVWQPVVLAAASKGLAVSGPAQVFGGTTDKPNVGVFGALPWPGDDAPGNRWKG